MPTPSTRTPVRIARGSYSNLNGSISDLQDGEISYAEDQNKLYVKEGSSLVALTFSPASPTFTGDVTFTGAANNIVFDASDNALEFAQDAKADFNGILKIYRDNANSYIENSNANLFLKGDAVNIRSASNQQVIETAGAGAVQLFWGGTSAGVRLATTQTGIDVTGAITATSDLTINAQGDLRLADSNSSHYVGFQSPATVTSNVIWTLPAADALSSGDALVSDGSGNLSFTTIAANPSGSNTQVQFNNSGSFGGSSSLTFNDSTDVLTATNVHDSKGNVRICPKHATTSALTVSAAESGKHIYTNANVTIPGLVTGLDEGTMITVINRGTSDISIIPQTSSGMEFYIANDTTLYTSARTLKPKGLVTILYVTSQLCWLSGAGIS